MKISCTDFNMYKGDNKNWTDTLLLHGVSYMDFAAAHLPEGEADQEELLTYAVSRGLHINIHAPFGINNISSTDSTLRASSVANVKRSIDLVAKYNLGAVTFHPGRLSENTDNPDEIWADLMDAVEEIAAYAKEKRVYVGIENMELRPYELVFTIDDLNRFARFGANNPYFGVTIDFAHYATHGIGLPDLKALKLPIYNVHLSQVRNGTAHHALTFTDGIVDVDAVCRLLADYGYDGHIALEIGNPLWESVEILDNTIRAL